MKGLARILGQFSDKLLKRKILPSLIEETRKHYLLPFGASPRTAPSR